MKKFLTVAIAATTFAGAALAGGHGGTADIGEPTIARQMMMGQVGKAMGHLAGMAKGETAYDARVADAAFRVMATSALGFGALFPEGSESGNETEAAPAIWSDREGFDAAVAKLLADASAAIDAAPADASAFGAVFGAVASNCRACHEAYRISKN